MSMLGSEGDEAAPEWEVARSAVSACVGTEDWQRLAQCRALEIYTDGSAPVANPGGPAGFSVVAVGYTKGIGADTAGKPEPLGRLQLGGYIPARTVEPLTSNNRAEIAGVLAALHLVGQLGKHGNPLEQVAIWSDSDYTVKCGNGSWQRKKNTDLWAAYDKALQQASNACDEITLAWIKGHSTNRYNHAADELATKAAFNFDQATYRRFRAAQQESGREMPGKQALARQGVTQELEHQELPGSTEDSASDNSDWQTGTDYTIVLSTKLDTNGRPGAYSGACTGTYVLASKKGHSYKARVAHKGERLHDEGEYLTLIAALQDLISRIEAAHRDPATYSLAIVSGRELMTKQLTGAYKVKSPLLQPLYSPVSSMLSRFGRAEVIWKQSGGIARWLREG